MKIAAAHNALAVGACVLSIWAAPAQARFLQVDPVGYKDQYNLYAYVGNDPANHIDPDGQVMLPPERTDPDQDWSQRMARSMQSRERLQMPDPLGDALRAIREAGSATNDFRRNYSDMREANTIGADKYYHCAANCEASSRGDVGRSVAERISNAREIVDQRIGGDPPQASQQDQRANLAGRNAGDRVGQSSRENSSALRRPQAERQCRAECENFRPRSLDRRH